MKTMTGTKANDGTSFEASENDIEASGLRERLSALAECVFSEDVPGRKRKKNIRTLSAAYRNIESPEIRGLVEKELLFRPLSPENEAYALLSTVPDIFFEYATVFSSEDVERWKRTETRHGLDLFRLAEAAWRYSYRNRIPVSVVSEGGTFPLGEYLADAVQTEFPLAAGRFARNFLKLEEMLAPNERAELGIRALDVVGRIFEMKERVGSEGCEDAFAAGLSDAFYAWKLSLTEIEEAEPLARRAVKFCDTMSAETALFLRKELSYAGYSADTVFNGFDTVLRRFVDENGREAEGFGVEPDGETKRCLDHICNILLRLKHALGSDGDAEATRPRSLPEVFENACSAARELLLSPLGPRLFPPGSIEPAFSLGMRLFTPDERISFLERVFTFGLVSDEYDLDTMFSSATSYWIVPEDDFWNALLSSIRARFENADSMSDTERDCLCAHAAFAISRKYGMVAAPVSKEAVDLAKRLVETSGDRFFAYFLEKGVVSTSRLYPVVSSPDALPAIVERFKKMSDMSYASRAYSSILRVLPPSMPEVFGTEPPKHGLLTMFMEMDKDGLDAHFIVEFAGRSFGFEGRTAMTRKYPHLAHPRPYSSRRTAMTRKYLSNARKNGSAECAKNVLMTVLQNDDELYVEALGALLELDADGEATCDFLKRNTRTPPYRVRNSEKTLSAIIEKIEKKKDPAAAFSFIHFAYDPKFETNTESVRGPLVRALDAMKNSPRALLDTLSSVASRDVPRPLSYAEGKILIGHLMSCGDWGNVVGKSVVEHLAERTESISVHAGTREKFIELAIRSDDVGEICAHLLARFAELDGFSAGVHIPFRGFSLPLETLRSAAKRLFERGTAESMKEYLSPDSSSEDRIRRAVAVYLFLGEENLVSAAKFGKDLGKAALYAKRTRVANRSAAVFNILCSLPEFDDELLLRVEGLFSGKPMPMPLSFSAFPSNTAHVFDKVSKAFESGDSSPERIKFYARLAETVLGEFTKMGGEAAERLKTLVVTRAIPDEPDGDTNFDDVVL